MRFLVTPICYYYVLDGTVYQCPDIHSLVQSRFTSALDPLVKSLNYTLDSLRHNVFCNFNNKALVDREKEGEHLY